MPEDSRMVGRLDEPSLPRQVLALECWQCASVTEFFDPSKAIGEVIEMVAERRREIRLRLGQAARRARSQTGADYETNLVTFWSDRYGVGITGVIKRIS